MQGLMSQEVVYTYAFTFFCLLGLGVYLAFQKRQTKKFLTRWFAHECNSKIKV